VRDLAPGRPLHPETWNHVLAIRGFTVEATVAGGDDRSIAHVGEDTPDSATVNAAIDAINHLLLGPAEYVVVATRER